MGPIESQQLEAMPANTNPEAPAAQRRFVVVTPCRDEEDHLEATIKSIVEQTVRPTLWIIVDDGSRDRTPQILDEACKRYDFIKHVPRDDRGERRVGAGVIDAFYDGLATVDVNDYEYVCKLDADLELPTNYFSRVLDAMEADSRLGSYSGKVFIRLNDSTLIHERRGDEAAVGPSKFYRVACFNDIGGFVRNVGWDGIDGHMCRMKGWIAQSVSDPELRIIHRRTMGSSQAGVNTGRLRGGAGKWFIGNSFLFVFITALYRLKDRPFVIGSALMCVGFVRAWRQGLPRFGNAEYRKYMRRWEMHSLLRGKHEAMRRTLSHK